MGIHQGLDIGEKGWGTLDFIKDQLANPDIDQHDEN